MRGRLAVALLLAAVLLVVAQLVLPGIAADRIASRVGRYGSIVSVSVHAWPAVELLWGDAESATVSVGHLSLTPTQTAALIAEARGVANLDVTLATLAEGQLQLSDARFRKRGSALNAQATITGAAVRAVLPPAFTLTLLASGHGQVRVRASGGLFGLGSSVEAIGEARLGRLVAHPLAASLRTLSLTLFGDPRIEVTGVAAGVESAQPVRYRLGMSARLR